jgi:hypothetical protein
MDWVIGIFIVLFFVSALYSGFQRSKRQEALKDRILRDFSPDEIHFSAENKTAIGLNFKRKTVILYSAGYLGEYGFTKIASVEVLRDSTAITQTNRGSQIIGAVVGDVLLGGIGTLIGGLSGSKRSKTNINQIDLKLIVDCQKRPVYIISFFETTNKKGLSAKDSRVKSAVERLDRFHAHIVNAIRNSDLEMKQPNVAEDRPPQLQETSGLHSLKELFELKQIGAITDGEYERAKSHVLAAHAMPNTSSLSLEE